MSVVSDLVKGGLSGLFDSAGNFATKIRSAITGKTVLNAEELFEIEKLTLQFEADKAKRQADLDVVLINADREMAAGQVDINKIEAASSSFFKSGWRPAVGWVCVLSLLYQFIARPILPWVFDVCQYSVKDLPSLDMGSLLTLLGGLLGLGGLRTFEKYKKVS